MADQRPETMYPDDNGHLYENNSQIHPSQPDLPPKGQPPTPHHLPPAPSQQNLTTECPPAFQAPPPGYNYPQPPPPGAAGYYQPQPGPYPGYPPQYPPPAGYPNYMPPQPQQQQQQQQQQQVIISNASQPTMIVQAAPRTRSYGGDIALACFVFWCCGWLFGGIAFILAVMANNMHYGTQSEQLSRASRGVSIAGIVVGVIIIAVVIGVNVGSSSSSSCNYYVSGTCYKYRTTYSSASTCYNYYTSYYYDSYNDYCYYNY